MIRTRHYLAWNTSLNEPEVNQGTINGWHLSWNPDDNRFYVSENEGGSLVKATFKDWKNAVQYARKHRREK